MHNHSKKRKTWTDDEMRIKLENMGYDLSKDENDDDEEEENYGFDASLMAEIATLSEGFKWDDKEEVWYK